MTREEEGNEETNAVRSTADAMKRFRQRSGAAFDEQRNRTSQLIVQFLGTQWHRFRSTSRWEKTFMLGGLALALTGVAIVAGALMRGSTDRPAALAQAATPAAFVVDEPTVAVDPTATPTANISVLAGLLAAPTAPPNRADCEEIRGTQYASSAERDWFLANCQEPIAGPSSPSGDSFGDSSNNLPKEPTPVAESPGSDASGLSASEVISLAVDWMSLQGGLSYNVIGDSCSAAHIGSHWTVSCQVQLAGCQSALCLSTVSACVTDADAAVLPGKLC